MRRRLRSHLPSVHVRRQATRMCEIQRSMSDEYDSERFPGNFYPGLIVILDRARGRGSYVRAADAKFPSSFPSCRWSGAPIGGRAPGIEFLREGDSIGFDVGWTSKGLRITSIKPAGRSPS